jgi:hypothetical protein
MALKPVVDDIADGRLFSVIWDNVTGARGDTFVKASDYAIIF